jgi:hypothetical protein
VHVNRRTLVLAGIALAVGLAWSAIREGGRDVGVLRTFDVQGKDLYTTLWVIDDTGFVWIRATRPDRKWLLHVQQNPDVQLRRSGRQRAYRAMVFDNPEARAYVDPRFREKYGLADRWREWRNGSDTIPIRLEPR